MADLIHPTNRFLFPVFSFDWLEMLTLTQLLTKYQLNLRGKNAYYGKLYMGHLLPIFLLIQAFRFSIYL